MPRIIINIECWFILTMILLQTLITSCGIEDKSISRKANNRNFNRYMKTQDDEALRKIDFGKLNFQQRIEIFPFLMKYNTRDYIELCRKDFYLGGALSFYKANFYERYFYDTNYGSCRWILYSIYCSCKSKERIRSSNCTCQLLFQDNYFEEGTRLSSLHIIQMVLLLRELIQTRKNYRILRECKDQGVLFPWIFFSLLYEEKPDDPSFYEFVYHDLDPFTDYFNIDTLCRLVSKGVITMKEESRSYLELRFSLEYFLDLIVDGYFNFTHLPNRKGESQNNSVPQVIKDLVVKFCG